MSDTTINTAGSPQAVEVLGHPRGLMTLFFLEMWERLSYYGMRALLVLFMADQVVNGGLGFTDETATAVYGLYTAGVYLAALPGGWIADRLMGGQRSVFVGGFIIMCGHFVLAIPSLSTFFLGLVLVVLGTGLLKPNASAIVGELYAAADDRRDAGFTIFYMGINLGAFLGPLICGTLAQSERFGWHWGFGAAGVGMALGLVQYWWTQNYLGDAGRYPTSSGNAALDAARRRKGWLGVAIGMLAIAALVFGGLTGMYSVNARALAEGATYVIVGTAAAYFAWILAFGGLDRLERNRVIALMVLFIGSALFWSGFEQAGTSLNFFADRYTQLDFGWIELKSTWFQSLNSLFIIVLLGPLYAWVWVELAKRHLEPSTPVKFALGLIILALGFLVMVGAANVVAAGNKALPTWLFFTYFLHTAGELALSPVGLSATTKLAPRRYVGQMMGVWFITLSLGNLVAGLVAGEFDAENVSEMPGQYLQIVLFCGGAGILLLLFSKPLKKLMGGVH